MTTHNLEAVLNIPYGNRILGGDRIYHKLLEKKPKASRFKRLGQIGTLVLTLISSYPAIQDYNAIVGKDYSAENVSSASIGRNKTSQRKSKSRQHTRTKSNGDSLDGRIERISTHSTIENTGKYSPIGRFLRTRRYDRTIASTERKYGIPQGLLAGLIMQESCGEQFALNLSNDGGAGLLMFQPGTFEKELGHKAYGKSISTGADHSHGEALSKLVQRYKNNPAALEKLDLRFNPKIAIDAGGRYLHRLYERFGMWDKAVLAYNTGSAPFNPWDSAHVRKVYGYMSFYNLHKQSHSSESALAVKTAPNPVSARQDYKGQKEDSQFRRVASKKHGTVVFEYVVSAGSTPSKIASHFNRWDKHEGDYFQQVNTRNIIYTGRYLQSGKPVHVYAKRNT